MTISSANNSQLIAADGTSFTFQFGFVGNSTSVISATYIDSLGNTTLLSTSQYTLTLNAPASNQLWSVGGSITYPSSGSAMPIGSSLLLERTLPLTQGTTVRNQGNYYAQVTEQALDLLEMQLQQVSADADAAIQIPAVDSGINTILPPAAKRANTFLAFDSGGNAIVTSTLLSTPPANPFYAGGTTGGTTSAFTLTTNPANFVLVDGCVVTFRAGSNALAGATLNVASTGAFTMKVNTNSGLTNIAAGQIVSLGEYTAIYNTSAWVIQNPSSIVNNSLAQMPANTILANASAISATPTDFALTAGTILGMSNTGNIAALAPNSYQSTIASPAATSSLGVYKMMGLAGSITPNYSGVVFMSISGTLGNTSNSAGASAILKYGTGSAPVNAAAVTGTTLGATELYTSATANLNAPFCLLGVASALSVGNTYWIDAGLYAASAGTASMTNVTIAAYEIK